MHILTQHLLLYRWHRGHNGNGTLIEGWNLKIHRWPARWQWQQGHQWPPTRLSKRLREGEFSLTGMKHFTAKQEWTNSFLIKIWSSPISLVFLGTSLRSRVTILMASNRISMTLFRRASRGARGNAATKMVVKLNWITVEKGKKINQNHFQYKLNVFVLNACSRIHTHLQKLLEQAEGVHIIKTIVAEPVSKLAVFTQLSSMFCLWLIFQVAVGTFPL